MNRPLCLVIILEAHHSMISLIAVIVHATTEAGRVGLASCPYSRSAHDSFWKFFPKQLTVGVLNATLDLALVLVGVVGFLGSEVVLSPVVSHCLQLSPFMWGVGVGWCGRLLGL